MPLLLFSLAKSCPEGAEVAKLKPNNKPIVLFYTNAALLSSDFFWMKALLTPALESPLPLTK